MSEEISTHTLTWSVTIDPDITSKDKSISTHTLTWSVTMNTLIIICNYEFQLTRSRGAWQNEHIYLKDVIQISTHTLTWSVTFLFAPALTLFSDFNSHAHVERDRLCTRCRICPFHFNSHAHVERDFFVCTRSHSIFRFQLTRSRGAWLYRRGCRPVCRNFNSHAHVERDNQLRLHNKNI